MRPRDIPGIAIVVGVGLLAISCIDKAFADYNPDSYGYVMIFTGVTEGNTWIESTPTSEGFGVGYVKRLGGDWFGSVRWEHTSQLQAGKPFNDMPESWIDHVGVTLEWRW